MLWNPFLLSVHHCVNQYCCLLSTNHRDAVLPARELGGYEGEMVGGIGKTAGEVAWPGVSPALWGHTARRPLASKATVHTSSPDVFSFPGQRLW